MALACVSLLSALSGAGAAAQTATAAAQSAGGVASMSSTGKAADQNDGTAAATRLGTPSAASATAALRSADADAALLARIAKLPPLSGSDVDVARQSAGLRTHLSTILRFYRNATLPIQTVGEPSDVLYAEQSQSEATQIALLAFQAARNEAALLARVPGASGVVGGKTQNAPAGSPDSQQTQAERIAAFKARAQDQLAQLQSRRSSLTDALATAPAAQRAALLQQQEQVDGGIELQQAMVDALNRVNMLSVSQSRTGLAGDIDRLQRSAPELLSNPVKTPAPPVLQNVAAATDAGVTTQASVLFQLLNSMHTVDQQITAIDVLSKQAQDLRAPFLKVLRSTISAGQALSQQQTAAAGAEPADNASDAASLKKQFDALTNTFRTLSSAMLPLSQEALLLDNARGTLTTWRATMEAEQKEILRHLLLRVAFIAVALGVLALVNRTANRAAVRYVSDVRRRRQLLLVRRITTGFLTGLVLIFGFVTQFSSIATFAGFISAGIAVGLQSILLSVAAYFFIVGRYGIRVGDRVTVANVTGEVIEVGLVRFYLMELVGTGTELHPTGRVAVFANSVLFQSGTPVYKQVPGTEYAWHELIAKLKPGADVRGSADAMLQVIREVYGNYSTTIEKQHRDVEAWIGTALPPPQIEPRLQLSEGGVQFAVLFPVELQQAAEVDERIAERLLLEIGKEGPLKAGLVDVPVIKAAVKA